MAAAAGFNDVVEAAAVFDCDDFDLVVVVDSLWAGIVFVEDASAAPAVLFRARALVTRFIVTVCNLLDLLLHQG